MRFPLISYRSTFYDNDPDDDNDFRFNIIALLISFIIIFILIKSC